MYQIQFIGQVSLICSSATHKQVLVLSDSRWSANFLTKLYFIISPVRFADNTHCPNFRYHFQIDLCFVLKYEYLKKKVIESQIHKLRWITLPPIRSSFRFVDIRFCLMFSSSLSSGVSYILQVRSNYNIKHMN